jgi:hypothetical protein
MLPLIINILLCNPIFKVEFTKRQTNMVVHIFVRTVTSWLCRYIFETLALCITPLLHNEMI